MQPTTTEQWSADALAALREAWDRVEDAVLDRKQDPEPWLYRLAPTLCVQRRGIKDKEQIAGLTRAALRTVEEGFEIDPEAKENFSINFLLAYLEANAYCEYITESEIDDTMMYLCDHGDFE